MSEKVNSYIFEMVVPENHISDTKTTDLLEAVVKIGENRITAAILENVRQRLPWRNLR